MLNYQHWGPAFFLLFAFALNFALILLPGFAVAVTLGSRRQITPVYRVIVMMATTATLGYASFWLFFISRPAGKLFTFLVYGLALFSFFRIRKAIRQAAAPFLLALLAGFCYLSVLYLFGDPKHQEAGLAGARFFETVEPGDNIIPLLFAEKVYNHEPLRPFCCEGALSSDRPPLQAGIFLLEQPLRLTGVGLHYQLLGTALQCLWVCGAWCLLTALGATQRRIRQVIVILTCSGFFFYNSVYVWPKLLTAAYMLCAFSIVCDVIRTRTPATGFQTSLAALCLGLALTAHPGSMFSLPAFSLLLLRYRQLFTLRQAGLALGIVLAFYLPWSAYQRIVDPPGNYLLKVHLAGQLSLDSRSTWQAIADAYRERSRREILSHKLSNIGTLFGGDPWAVFVPSRLRYNGIASSRAAQRGWIWSGLGLLNVGWLGMVWLLFRRKHFPAVPYSPWLLAGAIFNLIVWSAVLFGPGGTGTPHSSYTDIVLLSIGLCGYLLALPPVFVFAVFALQIWNFIVVWALFPPVSNFPPGTTIEVPFLVSGTLALGALIWIFTRACLHCEPPAQGCTLL
jgi:hypothetical protein